MKFVTTLLALTGLALATSIFAQDETPSPSADETPEAAIESTPESTPEPTPEATPIIERVPATPAAKPTPSPEQPPAPRKKETTPSAEETEKAPSDVAPSGKKMSVAATLKDLENRWAAAYARHDTASLAPLLANDYVSVSSKGKVQNKRAALAEAKADKDNYTSTKNEKLDVRVFGKDVAVVVGTYHEKGTGKDGRAFDRTYRFTDTWMERNGKWQCVAGQAMIVREK